MAVNVIERGAELSNCRLYRYQLTRKFAEGEGTCVFVCLNPFTADEQADDQMVIRCMDFAAHWGFGRVQIVNAFAWRSTSPGVLSTLRDPVGPDNDEWILKTAEEAQRIVCAWGAHPVMAERGTQVIQLLRGAGLRLHHLGMTVQGYPKHPSRLSKRTPIWEWSDQ